MGVTASVDYGRLAVSAARPVVGLLAVATALPAAAVNWIARRRLVDPLSA
jgi:hypothetical protein